MTRFHLGLTGFPLEHSLSPRIHTAALRSCGLEGDYSLFPVQPEDEQSLKNLLARVRAAEIHGLNVTIPHKQTVIRYLDELTPTARSIGAVNTIYVENHRLTGDNTDSPGFLADLRRFLTAETRRHRELRALVLGAGGSARAVVHALLQDEWDVTVAARRKDQAGQLSESLASERVQITDFTLAHADVARLTLVVNATPVGMSPQMDQSPWPENMPFPPGAAIYDLVYNPAETKLVRDARLQGLRATTGIGMLIGQAALAFARWTGIEPSHPALLHAVHQPAH